MFKLWYFAHEVYVLSPEKISDNAHNHVNPWHALANRSDLLLAMFFAIAIGLSLLMAFYINKKPSFKKIGMFIDRATVIAPDIIRVAFGLSLIFSARHGALFGTELPLYMFPLANILPIILYITGFALVAGFKTRIFGIISLILWLLALFTVGIYMFTYVNYFAEAIAVILLPIQTISLDRYIYKLRGQKIPKPTFAKFSLPVTRISFGLALLYTAIDVKFLKAGLSLDVVNSYHLTRFFPFKPLFIVLGAGLVEILIALLFLAGFLRRLTAVVFLVFVSLSVIFFKESVWPHYMLLALGIGIFLHKSDNYALDTHLKNAKHPLKQKSASKIKR